MQTKRIRIERFADNKTCRFIINVIYCSPESKLGNFLQRFAALIKIGFIWRQSGIVLPLLQNTHGGRQVI